MGRGDSSKRGDSASGVIHRAAAFISLTSQLRPVLYCVGCSPSSGPVGFVKKAGFRCPRNPSKPRLLFRSCPNWPPCYVLRGLFPTQRPSWVCLFSFPSWVCLFRPNRCACESDQLCLRLLTASTSTREWMFSIHNACTTCGVAGSVSGILESAQLDL